MHRKKGLYWMRSARLYQDGLTVGQVIEMHKGGFATYHYRSWRQHLVGIFPTEEVAFKELEEAVKEGASKC